MIATRIPLSEAARKIHEEKGEASHVESHSAGRPSQEYITFEDEQFEWREIIRGIPIVYHKCAVWLKERYRRFGRTMLAYCYRVHGSHRRFVLILLIFVREAVVSLSSCRCMSDAACIDLPLLLASAFLVELRNCIRSLPMYLQWF